MTRTPLHGAIEKQGGKVVDFHGWALPVQFAGIIQEHEHTRTKAGLFDCSHMGEFWVEGEEAMAAFDKLVIADALSLRVGRCRYSAMLNEHAGMVDDCVFLRLRDDVFYVVTNAEPLDKVSAVMCNTVPGARDLSAETAKLDIQGPLSRDILLDMGFECVRELKYWHGVETEWRDQPIVLARAGYTGELGYELYVPNALATPLWDALLAYPEAAPCGLGSRDTLRCEVGYPLNGEDVTDRTTPLEANMDKFIAWDSDFVGKDVLAALRDQGGYWKLTAIKTDSRRAPRHDFEVKRDGEVVGRVTSGTYGPSVGHGIGLAYLRPDCTEPGTALTAGPRDLPMETAEIPIYKHGTCRMKFD